MGGRAEQDLGAGEGQGVRGQGRRCFAGGGVRYPQGPGQGEGSRRFDLREAVEGPGGRVRGRAEQDLGDGCGGGVLERQGFARGGVRHPQGPGQGEGSRGFDLREADEGPGRRVRGRAEQDLGDGGGEGVPERGACTDALCLRTLPFSKFFDLHFSLLISKQFEANMTSPFTHTHEAMLYGLRKCYYMFSLIKHFWISRQFWIPPWLCMRHF